MVFFSLGRMLVQYIKGKTESSINQQLKSKREKRSLYINESFNNIKSVKLFGWEPDFLHKVDEVFQEEMDIEDKQHTRQKLYDVAEHMLSSFMEIVVISIYIALGNTMTL